jgi:hypothetical protein
MMITELIHLSKEEDFFRETHLSKRVSERCRKKESDPYDGNKVNGVFSYPEWWRDWPDETRQPVGSCQCGANSSRELSSLKDESNEAKRLSSFGDGRRLFVLRGNTGEEPLSRRGDMGPVNEAGKRLRAKSCNPLLRTDCLMVRGLFRHASRLPEPVS